MKWFLIQSLGLAALAFGLGALFHRLLWRKAAGGTFNGARGGTQQLASGTGNYAAERADLDARVAELRSVKAENLKLMSERDAKAKELSALSFEHGAAKSKLAEHEAALDKLRADVAAKVPSADGAVDSARLEHEGVVAKLREEHDGALASLRGEHEGVVAKLREEHDGALASLRGAHESKLAEVTSQHETALHTVRGEHEGTIASLRAEHDGALARVREEHDGHVQGLVGEHESRITSLVSEHEGSIAVLASRGHETLASTKAEHEATIVRLRAEADEHRSTAESARAELEAKRAEAERLAAQTVDYGSDDAFEGENVTPDDFLKIEGIGPKVNQILQAGGVRTYRRLAAMSEDNVRAIVNGGGVSFIPSAGTWAAQAALLRDRDHAGFQALVDKLLSGREEGR